MGVTSGSLDLEGTLLNSQERDIEGSSTKIENEDIALAVGLRALTAIREKSNLSGIRVAHI
ncbi:hypothetical protein AZE42_08747 [Rhizopogon vesiculosus]|uniref:Uncharacterized protein n=1 Tax=Rhizopogon vesiculosus TaxID=180088 RepID=A0A1J8PT87_9AGAM|nr:hypothetical protein AZE42_08747 [Rhizopogon vesiculosus]